MKIKKERIAVMGSHLTATGRHLPYGITHCYLLPDTSERAPLEPQPVSWYSIYLPGGIEGRVDLSYTRQCTGRDSNSRSFNHESDTLTTTLPSQPKYCLSRVF